MSKAHNFDRGKKFKEMKLWTLTSYIDERIKKCSYSLIPHVVTLTFNVKNGKICKKLQLNNKRKRRNMNHELGLEHYREILENIVFSLKQTNKSIANSIRYKPRGRLSIIANGKYRTYVRKTGKSKQDRECITSNKELAKALAEKNILNSRYSSLSELTARIEGLLNELDDIWNPKLSKNEMQNKARIMESFPEVARMKLTNETFWLEEPSYKNPFTENESLKYVTPGGVVVQSKSEHIIAIILEELNIPYKYGEYIFANGHEYYVDFIIYCSDGTMIYWEHLGLAGDENYDIHNLRKLNDYCEEGITVDKNLILTFEKDTRDVARIKEIIRHWYY